MKKTTESLQKIVNELMPLMATKATADVSFDKENEAYVVNIDAGDETGLLIGKKGETLDSIQTILGITLKQATGEWNRVVVNVGDYREKEEDYLKSLAESTAQRAKETGEPQSLYNLKPWQRRVVHMHLAEKADIVSESMGEGEERYLVVKAK
ncbi:MAG: KH domain-containing protein [Candidatus Woesebacteria bacterium]|nr:MAG: KH domain-containing protein [Candidatus Woesebacteria bacterium]